MSNVIFIRPDKAPRHRSIFYEDDANEGGRLDDQRNGDILRYRSSTNVPSCPDPNFGHTSHNVSYAEENGNADTRVISRPTNMRQVYVEDDGRTPPRMITRIDDTWLHTGETGRLKCEIDGYPIPVVEWLKDGRPFVNQKTMKYSWRYNGHWAELTILDVTYEDAGWYTCKASNVLGTRDCSCVVFVGDRIQRPKTGVESRLLETREARVHRLLGSMQQREG